ncbi:MAG TPA: ice-binding family protein [Acidimicrobiia bacterium]|nr:ice-binding family protein [Acidimicrobiia bacterium]
MVGFPPGIVQAPGTIEAATPVAQDAQADSTAAYLNAEGRPINATLTNDLSGLTLVGGVFEGPSQGPLSLTGTLTLDGEGDPNSVFIFQTDSTLITGSGSVVSLINGAQECNVFWQVGSSATLGTGSTFVGNILALTSISVTTNVTVRGRALAQTGAVTLDNDTFTRPTCATTTTGGGGIIPGITGTTPVTTTGTTPVTATGTTPVTVPGTTPGPGVPAAGRPDIPGVVGPPRTGAAPMPAGSFPWLLFVGLFGVAGTVGTLLLRRMHSAAAPPATADLPRRP